MSKFGERLKDLSLKLGKDDQDVASDLGLSKSQMSHYTTGRRKVPSKLLQDIIDVYGINPQFLFDGNAPLYKEETKVNETRSYPYLPVSISAGLPICVDAVTNAETIDIPDIMMGKHAGCKDIFMMRINGDSMNKIIPHNSLIGVRKVDLHNIKDGDIVVYSDGVEYAVKRMIRGDGKLIFRPDSIDTTFPEHHEPINSERLIIHGKVVLYLVEL